MPVISGYKNISMRATINCDMGEGTGNDEAIMPFITVANIACGYHAGDSATIWQTIELALKYNVAIGAHPSFLDRENFGRSAISLPPEDVYELITQQLIVFNDIAVANEAVVHHVKPHGSLYNLSVKDPLIAKAIAAAVKDFNHELILVGLSGSYSITEAKAIDLKTASEVFADRTYGDDGSLTPRSQAGALITDKEQVVKQVLQMIHEGTVTTTSGKVIPLLAETICIHSDGEYAVELAKAIYTAIV